VLSVADIQAFAPALAVVAPFITAALIPLFHRRENIREACTIAGAIATFAIVLSLLPAVLAGDRIVYPILSILPGLDIALRVDAFGLLFALTSSSLWILNSSYSIGYMRTLKEHAQTRYYLCFAIAVGAVIGIAFSANLITMFVFYEILTVTTYPLVVHTETAQAMRAGRKYLTYLLTAGVFFLFSVIAVYTIAGTTEFSAGGFLAGHDAPAALLQVLFVTFLIGFSKAAWMPLHGWLPSAMVAPTPVSALLHAVAVVKAGAFGVVRVVGYVFGTDLSGELGMHLLLASIASVTIIVASLYALRQDNLKKRLAYSTIGQLSYILLGVALLVPAGVTGAMLHIPFHAYMKITLFFCAGALIATAGKEYIHELRGIGKRMPVTMAMFAIASIGICGLPPVCGVISKWYLCLGTVEGPGLIFLAVILGSTVLNVAYFFPIIYTAFFEAPYPGEEGGIHEAPATMLVPICITAILSVVLFLAPEMPFLELAEMAVAEIVAAGVGA
jgi:multicomponent Na+:H+ antiporter subunit D